MEKILKYHVISTNDVWSRDNGPTFLVGKEQELAIVNWQFNGWGGRYPHDLDNEVSKQIAKKLGIPIFETGLIIEGGNIEVNGKGTLMATRSAVLNDNRNPGTTQEEVEKIFRKYLGVENFIWLSGMRTENSESLGWEDDADTHIDTIARFVNPDTIVYSWTDDKTDSMYPLLKKNLEELEKAVLESGKHPRLVPLPIPKDGYYSTSQIGEGGNITKFGSAVRTDASYTNFLISNKVVLAPVYGNVSDEHAIKILAKLFSSRKIIKINSGAIAENGGEIHCVTQQQPEGKIEWYRKE